MKRRALIKYLAASFLIPGRIAARNRPTAAAESSGQLPKRQFAWNAVLRTDPYGNPQLPSHHFLAMLNLNGAPSREKARRLEKVLSQLERLSPWGPDGTLFLLAWGPSYFRNIIGIPGSQIPVPDPRPLSSFEMPNLDSYHACLHVTGDSRDNIEAVFAALFKGAGINGHQADLDLRSIFHLQELRAGFSGAPLPSQNQDVSGIPPGHPVSAQSPLFMGFRSGFKDNQANEDDIAIPGGYFKDGTTMHVSRLRLRLNDWYTHLDEQERVARMFSPFQTPSEVANFHDNAPVDPDRVSEAAKTRGVAGHAQKTARARRKGRSIILRRDFNTVDGGTAGLHFVALQRSIDDFTAVRRAMNGAELTYVNPAIGPRINNGILEFMFVLSRANFLIPPRRSRSFPLLERLKP